MDRLRRPRSRNLVKHASVSSQMSPATKGSPNSTTLGNIGIHVVGDLTTTILLSINHYSQNLSSGSCDTKK